MFDLTIESQHGPEMAIWLWSHKSRVWQDYVKGSPGTVEGEPIPHAAKLNKALPTSRIGSQLIETQPRCIGGHQMRAGLT